MATARNSRLALLATVSLAANLAACAITARPVEETQSVEPVGLTLIVRNDNWLQVTVYVLRATAQYRLGAVSSMSTEIFRIPRHLYAASGTLLLQADPIGTEATFTTEPIPIGLARQIEWTVAEYLPASRLMLR
jgi:hypothetical protein